MTTTSYSRAAGALLGLHAQTALHPGTGTALGAVDLPVQRERHTLFPTIAGSALKGVLRDACRERISQEGDLDSRELVNADRQTRSRRERADNTVDLSVLFGPPTGDSSEFGGAVSITDARLLAFPVRSLRGVFAWVTCPQVLDRLVRDADLAGVSPVPSGSYSLDRNQAIVPDGCPCLVANNQLVLEEFEFTRQSKLLDEKLAQWIIDHLMPASDSYKPTCARLKKQLVILHDDDFTHFVRHATEVSARIGLNYESKTVKEGALFYQEFLPTETLFYSVVLVHPSRSDKQKNTGAELLQRLKNLMPTVLQVGGDETTGKGICAVKLGGSK